LVLEGDQDRADALLLEARALAQGGGSPGQAAAGRALAVERLNAALRKEPKFTAAYHLLAEIQVMQGEGDAAAATLRRGVETVPDDAVGLARLVELLAQPVAPSGKPAPEKLAEARALDASVTQRDKRGNLLLALAVGFHKADQLDLALEAAEKAAA